MSKKQLIMESALELFAKQGFEATSVQQITLHSGISKGAFYLSFKSKDELIMALIDQFMDQFVSDIDRIVKDPNNTGGELLRKFYYTTFHSFQKHSDFAKIFIKEQAHTFNEELLSKGRHFDQLIDDITLSMIDQLYGEAVQHTKYDLIYCIKGFMHVYSHLFLFFNVPLDLDILCQSLAEKTDLLAKHSAIPFITDELYDTFRKAGHEEMTDGQMIEIMAQKIEELEDSIEKESLILLKKDVQERSLSPAIIQGLISNIRNSPQSRWIASLLLNYYEL
ncbi:TetR/AcrR family transcriptional regulator [Cytobacillus firmus]|jgi:AcrR family transcriptional regulator|uniref:TetR/AcrR family transcriptional regulator n=1 Tax=Cytobacillus firmus TaxID=1399 RepID=A0AA46P2Y1_CYTFI|nr:MULTISPECIES: TetR/AcrR family transcriptional regulator [Cytobacillus]KML44155.1 transcriptional regulator [Cytobacillus firmus]MBY6054639.1 TetR/AcrR family transcriptional regulator [Cytobacillus firmus]MCC3649683.1 TetR/AcrR family transcriptional regulator [Cytobacillus oceanisediminis]MCS0656135.1 TetR/AcrR family transcriptional regulator [Cytobacillus firmus]MCU1808578.1 TetR/AcrR family transcriptional regulator [Cytobacillus firmus]